MHSELEIKIVKWAKNVGILEKAAVEAQLEKLYEEIDEWETEYNLGNKSEEQLELGDIYVVLVNIAAKRGYSLDRCGWMAYDKIKNRTGQMVDGKFVKNG